MPSSFARAFIRTMNPLSEPAELTPRAIAASFALWTMSAIRRSRTVTLSPALRPIQLASLRATSGVATTVSKKP